MEALARGVGATVPHPVEAHPIYDAAHPSRLDAVSQVFGATGWRRRFRLLIDGGQPRPIPSTITITEPDPSGQAHTSHWYYGKLQDQPRVEVPAGTIKFRILPGTGFDPSLIAGLLQFIADHAALGAKAQLGLGVLQLEPRVDTSSLKRWLAVLNTGRSTANTDCPSLDRMFFARVASPSIELEEPFRLKYHLRRLFDGNVDLRHFLMGEVDRGRRMGAKIIMSYPYGDPPEIRLSGWVPANGPARGASVVAPIYDYLSSSFKLISWREFDSPRDTIAQISDRLQFAESLL
jgi:CRISPR-associated protein Cmr1